MNYKIVLFFILLLLNISCKKELSPVFISVSLSEEYKGNCNSEDCPKVTIDYIIVKGDDLVSKKINSKIKDFIIASLFLEVEDKTNTNTIASAADIFIKNYQTDKVEFPELSTYFAEISVSESYSSSDLLCYETALYIFTGGAHGYGSISFLNIDPKIGEIIKNKDLFINEKEFIAYAEIKFREEMEIPEDKPINSTGFWFENNTFYLPESIGFTKENVILLYNQYEIASYSSGPVELEISLEKVLPYLKIK